jgi:hypothetical protein
LLVQLHVGFSIHTARWGDAYHNSDDLVFTKENGEPYDPHWVYVSFVASVHRHEFEPVLLHMLRHVAASLLIAAGIDIATALRDVHA